ncbi:MAG TPA: RsmE family RNA methyltransferase [Rectinemataceae bacterium]|nr:RsmE family RNA methyltransferase [Rectinemataceae bacterium]
MNILILERDEIGARLPRGDRRWRHVREVLRKGRGERIAAGIADGELGSATVLELDDGGMVLGFEPEREGEALAPLTLILGFPRPIQAARILRDLTSLGVARIELTGTQLGEKSYTQSDFFSKKQFRLPLLEGAEQAGNPRLPRVRTHWTLERCLAALDEPEAGEPRAEAGAPAGPTRLFLHPYGDALDLGALGEFGAPVSLAIGSERGWTEAEAGALRAAGFSPARLGRRILKTETATLAATIIVLSRLGLL